MALAGDPTSTICSTSGTLSTTTVNSTATRGHSGILAVPRLNPHQLSASTPCLNSTDNNTNPNTQLPTTFVSNEQLGHSNPSLSANNTNNGSNRLSWQIVRPNKRKKNTNETSLKIKMKRSEGQPPVPITPSMYQPIAVDDDSEDMDMSAPNSQHQNQTNSNSTHPTPPLPPPPPVFIHGVVDYQQMKANIGTVLQESDYTSRTLANNTVKINPKTSDAYRTLVRHLRSNNIVFHTYQIKQDRAYRVVIRHIHYSIPTDDIKQDIEQSGFKVRSVMNITHRNTKTPLNLFFVDLEPAANNKDIYNLRYVLNIKVSIEPPRKSTNIVQCTRCQMYGHTKAYCTRPFNCVKCGQEHSSTSCTKTRDLPAKCALCDGPHPANYKGCTVYKELLKMKHKNQQLRQDSQPNNGSTHQSTRNTQPAAQPNSRPANQPILSAQPNNQNNTRHTSNNNNNTRRNINNNHTTQTYADILKQTNKNQHQEPSTELSLSSFLCEFKAMFNQLMAQNATIINMLNTVVSSLLQK